MPKFYWMVLVICSVLCVLYDMQAVTGIPYTDVFCLAAVNDNSCYKTRNYLILMTES
jgi:hypothetical protein